MKTHRKGTSRILSTAALALALCAVPACALSAMAFPVMAAPSPAAADDAPATQDAAFHGAYTAWSGYSSTAEGSIVPGAVPVSAPASAQASGLATGSAASVLLRQAGQTDYVYAMAGDSVAKYTAGSWDKVDEVSLPAAACSGSSLAVVDNALVAVMQTGQIAMMSEDLDIAWVSDAPVLPQGAAAWGAASQVVADGGGVYVALLALDQQGAPVSCEVISAASIDGGLFWQTSLGVDGTAAMIDGVCAGGSGKAASPSLMYVDNTLVVAPGDSTLSAIDPASAKATSSLQLDGAILGRMALAPAAMTGLADGGSVLVVGTSAPTVYMVAFEQGKLAVASECSLGGAGGQALQLAPAAPVVLGGRAYFSATSAFEGEGSGYGAALGVQGGFCAVDLVDEQGAPAVAYADSALDPRCIPAAPVAVAYGANAREATVELYAVTFEGDLYRCQVATDGSSSVLGKVELAWTSASDEAFGESESVKSGVSSLACYAAQAPASSAAPVVARDGSVYFCLADSDENGNPSAGSAHLIAVSPDSSRAVSTPVGGSEGLDTLASSLAGITLPNGAGLGVGVLVFVVGFAAYAYIRNRGGRRAQDEGLDEWRSQHRDERHGGGVER